MRINTPRNFCTILYLEKPRAYAWVAFLWVEVQTISYREYRGYLTRPILSAGVAFDLRDCRSAEPNPFWHKRMTHSENERMTAESFDTRGSGCGNCGWRSHYISRLLTWGFTLSLPCQKVPLLKCRALPHYFATGLKVSRSTTHSKDFMCHICRNMSIFIYFENIW